MPPPLFDADDTPPVPVAASTQTTPLNQRVADLESAVTQLLADVGRVAAAGRAAAGLQPTVDSLTARAAQLSAAQQALTAIAAAAPTLEGLPPGSGGVSQPPMQDVRGQLPVHATIRYPTRDLSAIRRVVVHHTVTRGDILPERIAQVQVAQGKAGITYHFLITADGTIYWTQPLETVVGQMLDPVTNEQSVGVALAGNFTDQAPPAEQLASAAALIAWLLYSLHLPIDALVGRKEIETSHGSPGKQWMQGANYKATLVRQVQAILDAAIEVEPPGGTDVEQLQARVRELEATVARLQSLADQATALAQQVQDLRNSVSQRDAELARLRPLADAATALQAQVATLTATIAQREAEIRQLQAEIARLQGTTGGGVTAPPIRDIVDQLEKHPTLPPYPKRTKPISLIVIHHTDTPKTFTPQQIAHYHVFGERKNSEGKVIKEPWPGIGYHFLVGADGAIFQCQREETKSNHVGGEPNNYGVGVSLIGRFMKTDLQGKPAPPEDQLPTAPQLRSTAQLVAWLMTRHNVPLEKVMGHRDVWVGATACPGDQWLTGAKWKTALQTQVSAVLEGSPAGASKPLMHYVLFWDHGTDWARDDYRNAQDYIAHFRPTNGFAVDDALHAEHVTIIGGELGVSAADAARLQAAGCVVHRLAGVDEADTKAKLMALITQNTPWPGAPPMTTAGLIPTSLSVEEAAETAPRTDEWTVPDDWSVVAPPPTTTPLTAAPFAEPGLSGTTFAAADTSELDAILVPGMEEVTVAVSAAEATRDGVGDHVPAIVEVGESVSPWSAVVVVEPSPAASPATSSETPDLPAPAKVATLGSGMKARQQERTRKTKK